MYIAGVDLGGSKTAAGLVDSSGALVRRLTEPTDTANGGDGIARQTARLVLQLCRGAGVEPAALSGVGIASPGWVNAKTGTVYSSANLPLRRYALAQSVSALTRLAVRVENDANCAALGELVFGAGKARRDLLVLTVGTGLGAGVVRAGELMTGPGVAELGHTVLAMGGALCGCGRRGCCEAYCSAAALTRMANERSGGEDGSFRRFNGAKAVFLAAAAGDEAAKGALTEYLGCFAEMLMNFINIFRPELVLVGGGISQAGDAFFVPLNEKLSCIARANVYGVGMPDVLPAQNRNDAGILGAAALFL